MKVKAFSVLCSALAFPVLAIALNAGPLPTVPLVDLQRYLGTWHEIARFPNFFQKGCDSAVATYSLRPDGLIEVLNTCRKPDGGEKSVLGRARVVDTASKAKLKVSFVPAVLRWAGIGWGDYWVIDLPADYSYAVVSEPKREYLWILNREPAMRQETYNKILARLKELNFDVSKLISSGPGNLRP